MFVTNVIVIHLRAVEIVQSERDGLTDIVIPKVMPIAWLKIPNIKILLEIMCLSHYLTYILNDEIHFEM